MQCYPAELGTMLRSTVLQHDRNGLVSLYVVFVTVCATLAQGMQGPWSHVSPVTAPVNKHQSALAAMDQVQRMSA